MTIEEAILDSKKRAEEYAKHGYSRPLAKYYEQLAEWLEELKEYKELEEQGLLIRLPCKIGTPVYFGAHYYSSFDSEEIFEVCESYFDISMIEDFGDTVFMSKEEAEQALEKARCKNVK